MKLALVSASLVSLALLTGSGLAATAPKPMTHAAAATMTETDIAAIKLIDVKAHQLTLDDGKMFALPKSWRLHAYKVGEKVKVSYKDHMGSMIVTRIVKA
jgi:hypothetical protein